MDFFSKIFKPAKSGSSASPGKKSSPPPTAAKSEHETYVEFAREFVEELVENLPVDSTKENQAVNLDTEFSANTTIVLSDTSLETTLPDLLQPESVYKKQADTDTESHTTEYESALETDAHDSSSLNDGYVSDEVFDCAESIVDQQYNFPQTEQSLNTSDHQNLKKSGINTGDLTSTLTLTTPENREKSCKESILMPPYAFEDINKTFSDVENVGEAHQAVNVVPPLDISALCLDIANLRLNSTQEIECGSPEKNVSVAHASLCETSLESISFTVDCESTDKESSFDNEFNRSGFLDNTDIRTQSRAIHLYETADNELSVIILDQSADLSKDLEIKDVLSSNEVGCDILKHDISDPSTVTRETINDSSCDKSFLVEETAVDFQSLSSPNLSESLLHTPAQSLPEISEATSAVITDLDLATSKGPVGNADNEQSVASVDQLGLKVDSEPVSNLTTEPLLTFESCELLTDIVTPTLEVEKSPAGSTTVLDDIEVSQPTNNVDEPTLIESRPISEALEPTLRSADLGDAVAVQPPFEVDQSAVTVRPILESTKAPEEALDKSVVTTISLTFEPLDTSTNSKVEESLSFDKDLIPSLDSTKTIFETSTVEALAFTVDCTKLIVDHANLHAEVLDPVVDPKKPIHEGAPVVDALVPSVESPKLVAEGPLPVEALCTPVNCTKPSTDEGLVIDSKNLITKEGTTANVLVPIANTTELKTGEGALPVLDTVVNSTDPSADKCAPVVDALDLPIDSTEPVAKVVPTIEPLEAVVDCAKPSVEVVLPDVNSTKPIFEEDIPTVKAVASVEQVATSPVTTNTTSPVELAQPFVKTGEETSFSKNSSASLVANDLPVQLVEPPGTQVKDEFCGVVEVQQVTPPQTALSHSSISTAHEVSPAAVKVADIWVPVIHDQNTSQVDNSTSSSTTVEVPIVDCLINEANTTVIEVDALNKSLESRVLSCEVPLEVSTQSQGEGEEKPEVTNPTIQKSDPQANSCAFPEKHVNGVNFVTQVVGRVIDFDSLCVPLHFGNLAAEAAKVSNDLFNASREIDEVDPETSLADSSHCSKSAIMTDTESTRNVNETIGAVPLDVKWKSESRSALLTSNNTIVTPSNVSTKLSINGSRDSIIDYSQEEDPFKRRSLLRNSPPKGTCNAEKPMSEVTSITSDVSKLQVNDGELDPNTEESFHIDGEDVFKDPSAFDFLSSVGNSERTRDFHKESLYVKFDPLVGSTPVARTNRDIPLPPTFEEDTRVNHNDLVDLNLTIQSNSQVQHATPTKNPALELIDKLISLSPSPVKNADPVKQSPKPVITVVKEVPVKLATENNETPQEQEAMLEELHLLRELLAQQDVAHKAEDMKHRSEMETLQYQLTTLQQRQKEADEREHKLNRKIVDKAQGQKQMSMIMEEYEKTISRLVAEKEAEHQAHELDKETILKEKDLALGHLTNIEIAFSDVHMKYERSKNVIEGFKKNEEVLRASLAEYEATIHKQEQKYEMLKNHAMQQLESANQELDAVRRSQQAENAKLKAMLKKSELKSSSLEEMLEQKMKENQELASICDDLISKVGN